MELDQTIQRLSQFIYPPGYIENQSSYEDFYSQDSEPPKKPQVIPKKPDIQEEKQVLPQRAPVYVKYPKKPIKFKGTQFKAPFISNLNNPRQPIKSENWTPDEDKRLLQIVFSKNLTPNYAALYLKGRTPAACSRRFSRLKQDYTEDEWAKLTRKPKSLFKKNPKHWDLKQDQKLMEGIRLYGTKWSIISKEVFHGDRTPGAISDRFRVLRRRCGYIENGHGDNEDVELVNDNGQKQHNE